jgi:hypothetical protein
MNNRPLTDYEIWQFAGEHGYDDVDFSYLQWVKRSTCSWKGCLHVHTIACLLPDKVPRHLPAKCLTLKYNLSIMEWWKKYVSDNPDDYKFTNPDKLIEKMPNAEYFIKEFYPSAKGYNEVMGRRLNEKQGPTSYSKSRQSAVFSCISLLYYSTNEQERSQLNLYKLFTKESMTKYKIFLINNTGL